MRPWVTKKIVEYLGEEEKTLIDFILNKITAKTPPTEMLKQIGLVLDEEGEMFVIRMWRYVSPSRVTFVFVVLSDKAELTTFLTLRMLIFEVLNATQQ